MARKQKNTETVPTDATVSAPTKKRGRPVIHDTPEKKKQARKDATQRYLDNRAVRVNAALAAGHAIASRTNKERTRLTVADQQAIRDLMALIK